jgi:hypothetical protein
MAALERLSGLYRDEALNFSCREKVTFRRDDETPRHYTFQYIYVFRKPEGLTDYRTTWGKTSPVLLHTYGLPSWLERGYSWAFLFERGKRPLQTFRVEEGGTVLDRPALAVAFAPVPPVRTDLNDWHGTVWIDRERHQILRVEALKDDQQAEKSRFEAHMASPDRPSERKRVEYEFIEVSTEFSVEKNGMRFPGSVKIRKHRWEVIDTPRHRSKVPMPGYTVTQAYDEYRFFGIRTLEEVRTVISGEEPGPAPD